MMSAKRAKMHSSAPASVIEEYAVPPDSRADAKQFYAEISITGGPQGECFMFALGAELPISISSKACRAGRGPARERGRRQGIGELANVGTAAAIANAVWHATEQRVRELPIRLEKLLA
jgi:hypothetical protein